MPKGKGLNPADAYRKAQRKKELKKNKTERAKARDFALVKKDTRDLEDEIEKLEAGAELSASDTSRLASLKNELSKIKEKKDEYVKEHPEHRKLVYRSRRQDKGEGQVEAPPPAEQKRNLFNKHGLPRHPERSIYYDAVMNPYGVPPPGMPYIERPLATDEAHSDQDAEGSSDDIVMPEGPPPGAPLDEPESGSDDDIPMPAGPPPSTFPDQNIPAPPSMVPPPFPPPPPHMLFNTPLFVNPSPPQVPPDFNVYTSLPGGTPASLPPPGFFPRRVQSAAATQDPLSSVPHQTYQAHRASQLPPGHPSLPPKPLSGPLGDVPTVAVHSSATISAGPELRDLKKEATTFVPASLRKKKLSGTPSTPKVNAAPSVNVGSEATSPLARPDLVGVLKSQLGTVTAPASNSQVPAKAPGAQTMKGRDDYQKFVDEMSDLLGPPGGS